MSATIENEMYFLLAGAMLFLAAGIAILLRNTRGLPFRSRCASMIAKAWGGFVWVLPSRNAIKVPLAFVIGLVGGTVACGAVCLGLLYCYSFTRPPLTGDVGDAGEAIIMLMFLGFGLMISIGVGFWTALEATSRMHERLYPSLQAQDH